MTQKQRCDWAGDKPYMQQYHDEEWGVAVHDDRKHFEMLILEGAQAGLSWDTILKRRTAYYKAFKKFDPKLVAKMTDAELEMLRTDSDIIKNRLKIKSARSNAIVFLAIQAEFGSFDNYVWQFVNNKPKINRPKSTSQVPATSKESEALAKDLKKRGMSFVGSTIMYAFMQATGLVNDHLQHCDCAEYKLQHYPLTHN